MRSLRIYPALLTFCILTPGAALAQTPPVSAPLPSTDSSAIVRDLIRPGDQLNVQVFGDQALSQPVSVLSNGMINYPLIGNVQVSGKTPEQAAAVITQALELYVKHPRVTVGLGQPGQINVLVLGNVKTAGKYQVRSGGHLTDAIAAAGGLGPTNGDLPAARITAADGSIKDVSLQKLLHDGDGSSNLPLTNDSIVYVVGKNLFTIEVVGAVDRPGGVELNEGDRLSMAIARAGTSPNMLSDLSHVVVTRTDASGKPGSHEIDMYRALKDADMRYDPVLVKGDMVYVPQGRRPVAMGGFSPGSFILHLLGLGF